MLDEEFVKKFNNTLAPFCHGTDEDSADKIERQGIIPRSERNGYSTWVAEHQLDLPEDGVFLSSVKGRGYEMCFLSMQEQSREIGDLEIDSGFIFVMEKMPVEIMEKLELDPQEYLNNAYKIPESPWGMEFTIKGKIPPQYLKKMTPRQFLKYAREHGAYTPPTWRKFAEGWIRNEDGEVGLEWNREHNPDVLEEEERE